MIRITRNCRRYRDLSRGSVAPQPLTLPDFPLDKTCAGASAPCRCQEFEARYCTEATATWALAPVLGRERCASLSNHPEREQSKRTGENRSGTAARQLSGKLPRFA
jgi:hypothetical protein